MKKIFKVILGVVCMAAMTVCVFAMAACGGGSSATLIESYCQGPQDGLNMSPAMSQYYVLMPQYLQLNLYSDGTYQYSAVTSQTWLMDMEEFGSRTIDVHSVVVIGTYEKTANEEADGCSDIKLSAATRVIYTGTFTTYTGSYGYVDTADESTWESFEASSFGGDPQNVLEKFGKEKVLTVDDTNKLIVTSDPDFGYYLGSIIG